LLLIFGSVALWYNDKKWHFLVNENSLELKESDSAVLGVIEKKFQRTSVEPLHQDPGSAAANKLKESLEALKEKVYGKSLTNFFQVNLPEPEDKDSQSGDDSPTELVTENISGGGGDAEKVTPQIREMESQEESSSSDEGDVENPPKED